ncbi:ribonuclease E/G [Caulobacter sp. 17J65-9]|uniref:Rne/Rng family ribonuclease n=1 Tax=Caulobacter sp. 17J65-9 TaxID=2709382 RepID=UPI0013C6F059|nr:ribonuclease E/G [Caulobacter sp. 17J65-9]NEX94620.1 ribonuclease E/G [Caulobacter sp. 17J65-9]
MPKNMLIDAAHAEETRVAVVDGPRVEEFDFESRAKKQLRGNIYLAKVTRVEPSLQAAFVEYGGNRHGFLAFNEIHPDYYQIPVADREALMAEADDEDDDLDAAGEDEDEELPAEEARLRRRMMKRYKIQEVIKRRQILLVQVVKEERGNKGAALTTYLSLAGRYGVLMPNTARGGGISRKITQATDRKRLKAVVQSLDVPQGMGLIVRTAGAARTKAEIKRDYDYLLRVWENIRETTLHSIAPALIYEEESLVRRAIRDMYDKDIDAVLVEGDEAYKEARDFMRMLMPSQAKKVQHYREPTPLFVKERVEDVLAQIYSPVVPLKSGGYLVINQTEALVAVDVNSGRATKERNIEATALKTNLEAADEAARQLRLRDLAGLIVIDFIDMEESKNNRAVEKRLKDALKDDRARIQMGKISPFGLMEISRQRRRTGVLEGTTHVCEHCQGAGRVRSAESAALQALRAVEIESVRGGAGAITLRLPAAVALYVLNEKRAFLMRLHQTQGLFVSVVVDENLAHAEHAIERTETSERPPALIEAAPVRQLYEAPEIEEVEEEEEEEDETEDEAEAEGEERAAAPAAGESEGRRGRRRRRRRGGRRDEFEARGPRVVEAEAGEEDEGEEEDEEGEAVAGEHEDEDGRRRRRRRGRRGGRRMREEGRTRDPYTWTRARTPSLDDPYVWFDPLERQEAREAPAPVEREPERERERDRRPRREPVLTVVETPAVVVAEAAAEPVEAAPEPVAEEAPAKRRRVRRKAAAPVAAEAAAVEVETVAVEAVAEPEETPVEEPVVLAHFQPVVLETPPTAVEPVAAPEPDPHQISAPPATPKRGWWRGRG